MDDFLKNFAVYAVTVGYDSPIGNGNNYCLASPGGDTEAEGVPCGTRRIRGYE